MKKILFILLIAALTTTCRAAEKNAYYGEVSPGLEVIRTQTELIRGNLAGSKIEFSQETFNELFGEINYRGIVITTLPDSSVARLMLNGMPIVTGQTIPQDELDMLVAIPTCSEYGESSFNFFGINESEEKVCKLRFGDEEKCVPTGYLSEQKTYRNVSTDFVIDVLSDGDGATVEILETCKNGILTKNSQINSFTYTPKTNFTGKDRFRYRVVDIYGNKSEILTGVIQVEKAKNNLFFSDLAAKKSHNGAIFVCSNGLMDHHLNDENLPVFLPESTVSPDEFKLAMDAISKIRGRNSNDTMIFDVGDDLTKNEAISLLETAFQFSDDDVQEVIYSDGGEKLLTREECALLLASVF